MEYNIKSIREDFKKKGIFYTPKELAIFIKSFIEWDVKEIYDPTCWDWALLEVFWDEVIKYGQDINWHQIEVAKSKLKNFIWAEWDTLANPAFSEKRFDYIVANPPFSIQWEQNPNDERFNVAPALAPKSKADYAFILHILSKLTDTGIAVVMWFPWILYRWNSEWKIRQWLIDKNYIDKVVAVPWDKFTDTKIATCIIVLKKGKDHTNISFTDIAIDKTEIVSNGDVAKNDYQLSVNQYVKQETILPQVDAYELHMKARKQFIHKLRADLQMDKMICELDWFDFLSYLNEIKTVVNEYN